MVVKVKKKKPLKIKTPNAKFFHRILLDTRISFKTEGQGAEFRALNRKSNHLTKMQN